MHRGRDASLGTARASGRHSPLLLIAMHTQPAHVMWACMTRVVGAGQHDKRLAHATRCLHDTSTTPQCVEASQQSKTDADNNNTHNQE